MPLPSYLGLRSPLLPHSLHEWQSLNAGTRDEAPLPEGLEDWGLPGRDFCTKHSSTRLAPAAC
jgi:hypothetical protein